MKKWVLIALAPVIAFFLVVVAITLAVATAVGNDNTNKPGGGNGPGGGINATAPVPDWLRTLIADAVAQHGCPQLTPSLLAAQLYQESRFDPRAVSPGVGAQGIAQFMPGTWATQGIDGNGDHKKDPFEPADAVPAAAAYDCSLAKDVKDVPGDPADNMLAAYNAGPGAVTKHNGVPPFAETRDYVREIRALATQWAAGLDGGVPLPTGSDGASRAIAAAQTAMNTPYQWGGNCRSPYRGSDGCDCSSLVQMAWAAAGVSLPRTTYDQVNSGTAVRSVSELRPGDLLFSRGTATRPEHVGMYIGNNQVIEAPRTGLNVRIHSFAEWQPNILAMRHIG
ncbi:C40 family peptidase [Kitasatospora sp. NPDC004240]